jgi:hypothetical protein
MKDIMKLLKRKEPGFLEFLLKKTAEEGLKRESLKDKTNAIKIIAELNKLKTLNNLKNNDK